MGKARRIEVYNRQRKVRFDLGWLRRFAAAALGVCEKEGMGRMALDGLEEIEVSVVGDRVIAEVHERFMHVPGATDVITFEHGEIVTSAETAARYAAEHGGKLEEELGLYVVHGLLHLRGFDDRTADDAARMRTAQHRCMEKALRAMARS